MALYRRGSKGEEVVRIQTRLKELSLYLGPIDGDFGGGTESAVKSFQKSTGLTPDGIVGPESWAGLFPQETIPTPSIAQNSVAHRCLALTGAFETDAAPPDCFAGLTGDFDGQGLSFGVLQWNLGQGSLQPLLLEMSEKHRDVLERIFDDQYPILLAMLESPDREEQLAWARSIQDPNRLVLNEPWRGLFKTLGRTDECQQIEVEHSRQLFESALTLCQEYGIRSERAAALMFDIRVQNGSISPLVKAQIMQEFKRLGPSNSSDEAEVTRLRIIANRRAEAAKPRWIEDVRARKLTIAQGKGIVHGNHYDLQEQYGIRLQPFDQTLAAAAGQGQTA